MSTQTEHLGLHQWEAGDAFLRSDFNEDFAKIDAGVKAAHALAEQTSAAGSVLITDREADLSVELGFRPKLVILGMYGDQYKYIQLRTEGITFTAFATLSSAPSFGIGKISGFTDSGFSIEHNSWTVSADENKTSICYVAFR